MKHLNSKRIGLIATIAVLVFSIAMGVGATVAWLDDEATQETVDPGTLVTNGLRTDALVYSGNGQHLYDDPTARTATQDEGGTYGYDHSQTGQGTSYYLMLDRDNDGSVSLTSGDSLQMFTNIYNSADEACYFKLQLKANDVFKIYNSDLSGSLAESWYGYDRFNSSNQENYTNRFGTWPFEDDNGGDHNIRVKSTAATQAYDIYLDSYSGIWIDVHVDETRSKATSSLTGYYIIGSSASSSSETFSVPWSLSGGYQMYVDSTNTSNKGVYLGIYLEPNDIFKISNKPDATGEWHGHSNKYTSSGASSCFTNDVDDNFKCLVTGYYNIYLTTEATYNVSIERYAGGYTSNESNYTARGKAPGPRKSAVFNNTLLNYVQLEFQMSDSNNSDTADTYDGAYYYLELSGGIADTGSPGIQMFKTPGSSKLSGIIDASAYVGWTSVKVNRGDSTGNNIWQWTTTKTVTANTVNHFKVTHGQGSNWESIWWRDEGSEARFSKINEYYVVDDDSPTLQQSSGVCWNNDTFTPVSGSSPTKSGCTFVAWYSDSACTNGWTSGTNISHDISLYAKFTTNVSYYDLEGYWGGSNSWTAHASATQIEKTGTGAATGTITFEAIPFAVGDNWKIHRTGYSGGSYWGWNNELSIYATANYPNSGYNSTGNNIYITSAGTYDVTLNIDTGTITLTPLTYTIYQYASTGGSSYGSPFPITETLNESGNVVFDDVPLGINYYWHIESDATGDDAWGWNTNNNATDNIQATSNYASFFARGDHTKGSNSNIYNIQNLYAMTVDITFNKAANTIVISDIRITGSFELKKSTAVGGSSYATDAGASPSVSGTTVTINNVTLSSGYNYYLNDVSRNTGYGWDKFYVSSAYPTMTYATSTSISDPGKYFYTSNSNIGVKYGGQYDLTFDLATKKFTAVHLDSLLTADFKISIDSSDQAFTSSSGYVWTMTNLHMSIGSSLYIKNDNANSSKEFKSGSDLTINLGSYTAYLAIVNNELKSYVDCTISFTFTFDPASVSGTLAVTSYTKNDATITPYVNNESDIKSGLYWVNSVDSYSCGGSGAAHLYYGTEENAGCYYAYSGLVVNDTSTKYKMRDAYHLGENDVASFDYLLYEHQSTQALLTFSENGTDFGTSANQGRGYFIKFVSTGTYDILIYYENSKWTVEVKLSGKTVDTSTEHESKWKLIGRGSSPSSALYGCDFTTFRSLPMYCTKDNAESYPCYAGAYGGNGDTTNHKGNPITLMEGDQLALNTNNVLMAPTINSSYGTTSSSVVTITYSGTYYVYATESTFTIEFVSSLDSRTDTDRSIDSGDALVTSGQPYGNPASYTKLDGARVKRASSNSLSFAAGIDASMMDLASDGYVKIFVELRHINQSGKNGTLSASLSSVSGATATYSAWTVTNAATPVQSALGSFSSLSKTQQKNNVSFANGSIFSGVAVNNLASAYFSVATIIEIDIPLSSLTRNTATTGANASSAYGIASCSLSFTISLSYVEA